MRLERPAQHQIVGGDRVTAAQHDEVDSAKIGTSVAEALADQSLEPIAVGGATGLLAGDGETEPWRAGIVAAPCEHREVAVRGPDWALEDPRELMAIEQARGARKALSGNPVEGRWPGFDQRMPVARAARRGA
jgi:hypothetical protein